MAALDFGMALARGLVPTSQEAQSDLISRAGGRNVFKSEDWWNQQLSQQVQEGYAKPEKAFEYLTESGEWKPGERILISTRSGMDALYNPFLTGQILPRAGADIGPKYIGYKPPEDAKGYVTPYASERVSLQGSLSSQYPGQGVKAAYVSEQYQAAKPTGSGQKWMVGKVFAQRESTATRPEYFTAGELSDIEAAAKRGAQQAKRTSSESKATKRRLARATGGLMGKARQPGDEPSTGLPALGEGGLGITGSILGGGIKL